MENTCIMNALYMVNIALFTYCIIHYSIIIKVIGKCHKPNFVKLSAYIVSGFAILVSTIFVGLQVEWIINGQAHAIGDFAAWAWLVFDYLLALFLISIAVSVHTYCKWRHVKFINMRRVAKSQRLKSSVDNMPKVKEFLYASPKTSCGFSVPGAHGTSTCYQGESR